MLQDFGEKVHFTVYHATTTTTDNATTTTATTTTSVCVPRHFGQYNCLLLHLTFLTFKNILKTFNRVYSRHTHW